MTTAKFQARSSSTNQNIQLTAVESIEELIPYRAQIDSLSDVPFLKSSWMFPWIETYCESSCKLSFVIATNCDGEVIGFAPLVLRSSLKRGRRFCFVGSGKACADYMTFPVLPDYKTEFLRCFVDWLSNNKTWDRLELDGATDEDATLQEVASQLQQLNYKSEKIQTLDSSRMELPGSWEEVLNGLSKNSRKKYRRLARTLDKETKLHRATDAQSLREGFQILKDLHTARWKSLGESGCFGHQGFGEFLYGVAKEKLESDSLSLIWLTADGQPIAADIGFYDGQGAFTYQGGMSPDHLELEPGRAILKCQIELAIQRGCKFIDFLRGDEPYKARFKAVKIKNSRHEIVGHGARASAIDTLLQFGRLVKSAIN